MIKILVSACLLGEKVRYNGSDAASRDSILARWVDESRVVPFCPEVAGGLGVPRPAAEIQPDDRILTKGGADVTAAFQRGARAALDVARAAGARIAILKDGSPSCGSQRIYDGTFTGRRVEGQGTTAALFEREGIKVFSESQLEEASRYLEHELQAVNERDDD